MPDLLYISDVQAKLNVSRAQVYKLVKRKLLIPLPGIPPYLHPMRFSENSVQELLAGGPVVIERDDGPPIVARRRIL